MNKSWGRIAAEALAGAIFLSIGGFLLSERLTTWEVIGLFFVMVAAKI